MRIAVAIVAVTFFVYFIFYIIKGIIGDDPKLTFIGFTLSIALAVVTPLYLKSDTSTEVNVSTESEIEENIETTMKYMTSSKAEDSTKTHAKKSVQKFCFLQNICYNSFIR